MKLGEQIVAAEEKLVDLQEQMTTILKGAEDHGRELDEGENLQVVELADEVETVKASLATKRKAEKSLMETKAARAEAVQGRQVPAMVKTGKASDILFQRAHVALRSYVEKRDPIAVAEERYGHNRSVVDMVKAATEPAYTNVAGWAQELTDTATVGFIEELQAVSIYGRLAAAGIAIPFGGNNAITMPRRNGKGHVAGAFVGEGATIPVKQDSLGSVTFNRYKAAVITAFSKELQRVSNPQIEALLRAHVTQDTGDMLDSVVMDPAVVAVAGVRPASPFNGADTQASAGVDLASILTDLRFLIDTLSAANAGRNPYLILNPARLTGLSMLTNANGAFVFRDEINNGRLMGIPFIQSTNCPADQVYIIDAADFGSAFGNVEFDVSEQASLVMADDDGVAPTMAGTNAVTVAGSLQVSDAAGTTPPTVVRSLFQTWELGLRTVMPISWGMLRAGTVAYLTSVAW